MRNANLVQWILSLFTTPDRAASIAGDLVEDSSRLGPIAFWARVVHTALAFVWRDVCAAPIRFLGLMAAAYVTSFLIVWVFRILPSQLVQRPYDDSVLSSFWVRQTAYATLSLSGVFRGREIFLYYFVVGLVVARLSFGREMAACGIVVVTDLAFQGVAAMMAHSFAFHTFRLVAFEALGCWPFFIAALLVRCWSLRRAARRRIHA